MRAFISPYIIPANTSLLKCFQNWRHSFLVSISLLLLGFAVFQPVLERPYLEAGQLTISTLDTNPSNTSLPQHPDVTSPTSRNLCPHSIVVSAPRHGTTWVVNCLENCTFSSQTSHFQNNIFKSTELWSWMEGPLANISAERAVDYVRESVSIKVFPPPNAVRTLVRPENRAQLVKELIRHALRKKVPVFFLRRNLADSFASRQLAKIRSDWRQPTKAQRGGDDPSPEISLAGAKYRAYLRGMNRYFEEMESIVGDIPTIWYEDIVGKEWFFVPQVMNGQGCWVRDCNNQPSKS